MSLSEPMEHAPDWWVLIDKKAALRERFPPLAKVRNERPGCAADVERKRVYREMAELEKARQHTARWQLACEENERRARRAEVRRQNAEYKRLRDERKTV